MATIRPTLKTDHKKEDGTHSVRIRITKGQVRYYTTPISLRKADWNPKATGEKANWVRSSHREHRDLNEELEKLVSKFRKIALDNPHYTAQQIRDAYGREEKGAGFVEFAREWIKRKDAMGQHGSARAYETMLVYFTDYFGPKGNDPDDLTPAVIARFLGHLRQVPYAAGTINTAFTFYRTIIRHGILEGWITPRPNPFAVAAVHAEEKPVIRPSVAQLLSLMHLEQLTRVQAHARNVFLMQYFLNGARVSETYTLRWDQVGPDRITYLPKKRATKSKVIPRHEGVEWVLSQYERKGKYIFPYISEKEDKLQGAARTELQKRINGQIHSALKQLSFKAGIGFLTSHMQRHTFADHVWEQYGDLRILQDMLGHNSARTSEVYLTRLGQAQRDALNKSLYTLGESSGKDAGQKGETPAPGEPPKTGLAGVSERKRTARKRKQ